MDIMGMAADIGTKTGASRAAKYLRSRLGKPLLSVGMARVHWDLQVHDNDMHLEQILAPLAPYIAGTDTTEVVAAYRAALVAAVTAGLGVRP